MSLLKISNLSKAFGGVHAVEKLSFEIRENSITGLIGPNGAGKTTAFNLMTHFLPKDSGKVFFQGKDITSLRSHSLVEKGIARTFQQIRLFPSLTVKENLLLARSKKHDQWWQSFGERSEMGAKKVRKTSLELI